MKNISAPERKRFASPYTRWETIGWLLRNLRLGKKNPGHIKFVPKNMCLNKIKPKYWLAFIGDIMDLAHRHLEISPEIKNFIKDANFLIGNFEATITDAKPRGVDQVHDEKVIAGLKSLYPPAKTYLSVANNHAGDFGKAIFENSVQILIDTGFNVFGTVEKPLITLAPEIQLITGTMWSNRPCGYIAHIEDLKLDQLAAETMNIFYPHWGYDLELYPRLPIIELSEKFLLSCDAIVGHHTHAPQPVISMEGIEGTINKLCAYSLGDFCYGKHFGRLLSKLLYNYNYGIVLKMEVGPTEEGYWATGNIEWSFIKSKKVNPELIRVEMIDSNPYFPELS